MDDGIVRTSKTKRFDGPLLRLDLINDASYLGDFQFLCHEILPQFAAAGLTSACMPPNNPESSMPRREATVFASANFSNATIVAFTTLCGLDEPIDFVKTSLT